MAVNAEKYRTLDDSIVAYLTARPGMLIDAATLSLEFNTTGQVMRSRLYGLVKAGKIQLSSAGHRKAKRFYVHTEAEKTARDALIQARTVKPYVVPRAMQERIDALRTNRERFPSHYYKSNSEEMV